MVYKPYDIDTLQSDLIRHESREEDIYIDSVGKVTIGVGWNLTDNGLPDEMIDRLLLLGIDMAEEALDEIDSVWRSLTKDRQLVLLNMAFNLGESRLRRFRKMWAGIKAGDWEAAADEMVDSTWYGQVGIRAEELVKRMRVG